MRGAPRVEPTAAWLCLALISATGCFSRIEEPFGVGAPAPEIGWDGGGLDGATSATSEAGGDGAESADVADVSDAGQRERLARDMSLIASGTRFCENARECDGLDCQTALNLTPGICVKHCTTDADCSDREACIDSVDFPPSCMVVCESPTQCAYQLDCADYLNNGTYFCVPGSWAQARDI